MQNSGVCGLSILNPHPTAPKQTKVKKGWRMGNARLGRFYYFLSLQCRRSSQKNGFWLKWCLMCIQTTAWPSDNIISWQAISELGVWLIRRMPQISLILAGARDPVHDVCVKHKWVFDSLNTIKHLHPGQTVFGV